MMFSGAFAVTISARRRGAGRATLGFVVLTLVIQQCDGNIIGPKILGDKVGVDSLMIVVAITVSGGLWGLVGMFIGVPLFAVMRQAVKELVESRLQKKHLPVDTAAYMDKRREAAE